MDSLPTGQDERTMRRTARRSIPVHTPARDGKSEEVQDLRYHSERKRKGKQAAKTPTKKSKTPSPNVEIREPLQEPSTEEKEKAGEESGEEATTDSQEEPVYEKTEVCVTEELLKEMACFPDPEKTKIFAKRGAKGKQAKSGKRYHPESLQEIDSEDEFLSYIRTIGFDWLLKHSTAKVPVDLAKEFFTSFVFEQTTDISAESISFRLFGEEVSMSIREWSMRMGLLTMDEDIHGLWDKRQIGPPGDMPGFTPQTAWDLLTEGHGGRFKPSFSKGTHITNRLLRFAQTFIAYNLLGQVTATLTTAELYFGWCMFNGVKVHLGYWLAQACHSLTAHTSRHLYLCHLLGAYLQRNITMRIPKPIPTLLMCNTPELFNLTFLFNKGLLYMKDDTVHFYDVEEEKIEASNRTERRSRAEASKDAAEQGSPEATAESDGDSRTEAHLSTKEKTPTTMAAREWKEDVATLRSALTEKMATMETNVMEALETIKNNMMEEMAIVKSNIQEIQAGITSLHPAIQSFKEPLGINAEKMAEALLLMMKMVKFVQQQTFQPQRGTSTETPRATTQGTQSPFLSPVVTPGSNTQHFPTETAQPTISDDPPLPISKRPKALPRKPAL